MAEKQTVLVTGATGFIAKHCIITLLDAGYQVRGSLRSLSRASDLKAVLAEHADVSDLSFCELNLTSDDGWADAVKGCDFVQHVASPVPDTAPIHEDDLIIPAREGALRALRFSAEAGVKRVVLTSSIAAVTFGQPNRSPEQPFDENDWTDHEKAESAYAKSKTLAEQAAWDFMKTKEANGLELAVINPGAVLGPLLDKSFSASGEIVRKLLCREIPACPHLGFSMIDVRDVADAHLAAMCIADAAGQRFCVTTPHTWVVEISKILKTAGYQTPTRELPNFLVRLLGRFDPTIAMIVPELNKREDINNQKMRTVLKISPRSLKEMTLSMAKSMEHFNVV